MTALTTLQRSVGANKKRLTWKYWVLLAVWEAVAILIATGLVNTGTNPSDASFVGWTLFWVLIPLSPLLVPMKIQQWITSGVSVFVALFFVGAILWGLGAYVVVWLAPEAEWAYKWRYAAEKEGFDGAKIRVNRKPHDCDFLTAPLGSKHCHYERRIDTIRVFAKDGTRRASYDDGQTWHTITADLDPQVLVTWTKIDD